MDIQLFLNIQNTKTTLPLFLQPTHGKGGVMGCLMGGSGVGRNGDVLGISRLA
jgi:hypothetical protein